MTREFIAYSIFIQNLKLLTLCSIIMYLIRRVTLIGIVGVGRKFQRCFLHITL